MLDYVCSDGGGGDAQHPPHGHTNTHAQGGEGLVLLIVMYDPKSFSILQFLPAYQNRNFGTISILF